MVVTEFGFIKGAAPTATPAMRAAFEAALAAQARWLKRTGPGDSSIGDRAWLFQQVEDPGSLLLAARWDSVEEHHAWARSEPDIDALLAEIGQHLYQPAGPDDRQQPVAVVHTDTDTFPGGTEPGTSVLESPIISVSRLFVKAGHRVAFQAAYADFASGLAEYAAPYHVQTGWRVDAETDAVTGARKEEFVLVCGWPSVEKHLELADSPHAAKAQALGAHLDGRELKHFRRLL